MTLIVEKFKPLEFEKKNLDIDELNAETNVEWQYASSGKAALYHCLKSLNVTGEVLIPIYVCASILEPLKKLGLKYSFYDINVSDLNADISDIKRKLEDKKVNCVIVASLYGNPANLYEIQKICKANNVLMIDDAAQSFGAKHLGRHVGTFGNAGFFSFSPGKATPAHLGAFFWTEKKNYTIKRNSNYLLHRLAYIEFYLNRYRIYEFKKYKIIKIITYIKYVLFKTFYFYNDKINKFEEPILGGVLHANKSQKFRKEMLLLIKEEIKNTGDFKFITNNEKESNIHKIVIICKNISVCEKFKYHLNESKIYASFGYKLLENSDNYPGAKEITNKIIEIPLEECKEKNKYIIKKLNEII